MFVRFFHSLIGSAHCSPAPYACILIGSRLLFLIFALFVRILCQRPCTGSQLNQVDSIYLHAYNIKRFAVLCVCVAPALMCRYLDEARAFSITEKRYRIVRMYIFPEAFMYIGRMIGTVIAANRAKKFIYFTPTFCVCACVWCVDGTDSAFFSPVRLLCLCVCYFARAEWIFCFCCDRSRLNTVEWLTVQAFAAQSLYRLTILFEGWRNSRIKLQKMCEMCIGRKENERKAPKKRTIQKKRIKVKLHVANRLLSISINMIFCVLPISELSGEKGRGGRVAQDMELMISLWKYAVFF